MASFLDRLLGRSSTIVVEKPTSVPAVKRRASRKRGYAAAGNRAQFGEYYASSGSADYELMNAMVTLRNKLRALSRNSGTMKRYLSLIEQNVVGPDGYKLQVRVRRQDGSPDVTLNQRVTQAWAEWGEAPTVDGQMDLIEFEKQMAVAFARDGEYIVEMVRDFDSPDGFLLNPIESDMLDESMNGVYQPTGNVVRMGVEVTEKGRPVAYHILQEHPGDSGWHATFNRSRHRRVPADRIIHIFKRHRAGQSRGEPQGTSIIGTTKMLDGYREAEITARRIKASAMGFAVQKDDAQPGVSLDGMADRVSEDTNEFEMDLEPGTIKALPRGYDFKQFDPGGSVSDFQQFDGQMKSDASMGVSISPVSLGYETAKLSYSTHRGIVAEDRETYKELQSFLIRMGMRKIFKNWLAAHLSFNMSTTIPVTRRMPITNAFKFRPRGWDQIDPTKDTKAENEQLAARTTSLSRIAAKRGMDRDELLDEIEDDMKALAKRGLTQSLGNGNTQQTTSGGMNNDVEDDDDEA